MLRARSRPYEDRTQEPTRNTGVWGTQGKTKSKPKSTGEAHASGGSAKPPLQERVRKLTGPFGRPKGKPFDHLRARRTAIIARNWRVEGEAR
jgi:hypothetical protein